MVRRNQRWDQVSKQNSRLDKLIKAFEVRNQTLNRSPKTVTWYSSNLRMFKEFLETNGYSLELRRITIEEARKFIAYLQNRNRYEGHPLTPVKDDRLSPQTIRGYVETLKGFFSWLCKEGYTEDNRLGRLEFPKVPRKFVDVLTEAEIRKILSHLNLNTTLGTRNATIIMILLDTGLRCAELVAKDPHGNNISPNCRCQPLPQPTGSKAK